MEGTTRREPPSTEPASQREPRVVVMPPSTAGLDMTRLRSALRQLAGGLVALHAMGKLHRDVKPSNVMVDRHGRVVILDFGMAVELKQQDDPQATERPTEGTVSYMSPEQSAGRALSPASDWYSLGVMLFRALTGQLPFLGTRLEVLTLEANGRRPGPACLCLAPA